MTSAIPTTIDECTPDWLTEVLKTRSVISVDAVIVGRDVEILGAGQGFMCELARLTLQYGNGSGPDTVVAKIPTVVADNRNNGELNGVYERELRVYEELLPQLDADIPLPGIYYAAIDANPKAAQAIETLRRLDRLPLWLLRMLVWALAKVGKAQRYPSVLLIEDLRPPAQIGDQVAGCGVEQAREVLTVVARLHAASWGDRAPQANHWIVSIGVAPRFIRAVFATGQRKFKKNFGHVLGDHTRAALPRAQKEVDGRLRRLTQNLPQCLTHGDYRLDNMFFNPDGSVAAVIDWQTARLGPAVIDVAYFISGSVHATVPESDVEELLAHYHRALEVAGVGDYPLEQLRVDYDEALWLILASMPVLELLDFGDEGGRGTELVDQWVRRVDTRLLRVAG
jgi:hypothetical protein